MNQRQIKVSLFYLCAFTFHIAIPSSNKNADHVNDKR